MAADIDAFYRVWLGRSSLGEARHRGTVRLEGAPTAVRGFSDWFAWSPMADAVRSALARRPAGGGKPARLRSLSEAS